jgi:Transcriptional regulator
MPSIALSGGDMPKRMGQAQGDTRRSMGRRERRRAETRERIFRAGLRLFAERGFSATTVEDITEAADVGKGTFFNYFPSKDHLLAAFGEMQVGKFRAAMEEALAGRRSMREVFRRALRALAEEPGRSDALVRSLMAANLSNESVRQHMQKNLATGRQRLTELLQLAQKRKEVRADVAPDRLARALQQTFFGGLVLWSLNPDRSLGALQDGVFKLIWPAIEASRNPFQRRNQRA